MKTNGAYNTEILHKKDTSGFMYRDRSKSDLVDEINNEQLLQPS